MQTKLPETLLASDLGRRADSILRTCVHCGFCNATCPTFRLFGDELDGPRGRIYQIKQMLEGEPVGRATQRHLDRCLNCRNCETTCPSGVRYGELMDIGREFVARKMRRTVASSLVHWLMRAVFPYPRRFAPFLRAGQTLRPFLRGRWRRAIPAWRRVGARRSATGSGRVMIALAGCVQAVVDPTTNANAAQVLDALGIRLIEAPDAGCCGSLSHHFAAEEEARAFARRNIDAWWPMLEQGAEAIVMTASGCGLHVKEYGRLLDGDPDYREKAQAVSGQTRDLAEVLAREDLSVLEPPSNPRRIAFHPPCTLQHGQQVHGLVEDILLRLGHELVPVSDAHLCCGSAGAYSLLHPRIAQTLRREKLENLEREQPELIVTANIGCQTHLQSGTELPVRHWIDLLLS
ncbi:MAG: glycolate oxidase subunit GlcF [Acidiferrobacteraceae bacterium]|jgi:glycolate oxidase iron-sulfur subunit